MPGKTTCNGIVKAPVKVPKGAHSHPVAQNVDPIDYVFVLVPAFSMLAFTSAVEVLRVANQLAGRGLYRWTVLSETGEPVASSNGLSIGCHGRLSSDIGGSRIFICAGVEPNKSISKTVWKWAARQWAFGAQMGGLCTGAFALAKAGILSSAESTLHWENIDGFREQFPTLTPTDKAYVVDGRVSTSAGGATSADLFLTVLQQDFGSEFATIAREMMNISDVRGPDTSQAASRAATLNSRNKRLIEIIGYIDTNLEADLALDDLAEQFSISRRQMERLFAKYLHRTPRQYISNARLAKGRRLLIETDLSVMDVAIASGFNSAQNFSKLFRLKFGTSPSRLRAGS
ncbi:GlxA family transcriptional regulator [uncultured Roseobacter sp.]|uniref:GlxA family transcriptional regulator n=1 Tax=uncultured Roseobacter sp. TaxID=114847 RepID=UPI0026392276|nr:GlxA family transcriptional regulator [uncultured Roseobacter sp.]